LLNLHTSEASARDGGKYFSPSCTEAEFLDKIQKKVALRYLFLQTHAVSAVGLLYTAKEKGGKPDRKP
jgi:hypothetical protein